MKSTIYLSLFLTISTIALNAQEKIIVSDKAAQAICRQLDSFEYQQIKVIFRKNDRFILKANADTFLRVSYDYYHQDLIHLSRTAAFISYVISDTLDATVTKAEAAYHAGFTSMNLDELDQTEKWTWKALDIYKQQGKIEYSLDAYMTIISVNFNKSLVDTVLLKQLFKEAFEVSKQCENCKQNISLKLNYAQFLHKRLKNGNLALETYFEILDELKDTKNTESRISYFFTLIQLSEIENESYEYSKRSKIMKLFTDAMKKAEELNIDLVSINLFGALWEFYFENGNYLNAFLSLQKMRQLFQAGKWVNEKTILKRFSLTFNKDETDLNVYINKLLRTLIYTPELKKYSEGIDIAKEILDLNKKTEKSPVVDFSVYGKLFELYTLLGESEHAILNFKKTIELYKNFSKEEQTDWEYIFNSLNSLYVALYSDNILSTHELRKLAKTNREIPNGGVIAVKILDKAENIDSTNNNIFGRVLNLELKLLCHVDNGEEVLAMKTLYNLHEIILDTDILKDPYFKESMNEDNKKNDKEELVDRLMRKSLYPSLQYAIIQDDIKKVDKEMVCKLLNMRILTGTRGRMNRWFNTEDYEPGLLIDTLASPVFDISETQRTLLLKYAFDQLDALNLKIENQSSFEGVIYGNLSSFYLKLDDKEKCLEYFDKSLELLIDNPPLIGDDPSYYERALWDLLALSMKLKKDTTIKNKIEKRLDIFRDSENVIQSFASDIDNFMGLGYSQKINLIDSVANTLERGDCSTKKCKSNLASMKLLAIAIHLDNNHYGKVLELGRALYFYVNQEKMIKEKFQVCKWLSRALDKLGDFKEAEKYLLEAKELADLMEHNDNKSSICYDLGFLNFKTGKLKASLEYYQLSLEYAESKNSVLYANALAQIGFMKVANKYNIQNGESFPNQLIDSLEKDLIITESIANVEEAIFIHKEHKHYGDVGVDYKILSDIFLLRNYKKSKAAVLEAIRFYDMDDMPDNMRVVNAKYRLSRLIIEEYASSGKDINGYLEENLNLLTDNLREVIIGAREFKNSFMNEDDKISALKQKGYDALVKQSLKEFLLLALNSKKEQLYSEAFNYYQFSKADILNQNLQLQRQISQSLLAKENQLMQQTNLLIKDIEKEKTKLKDFQDIKKIRELSKAVDSLSIVLSKLRDQFEVYRNENELKTDYETFYQSFVEEYSKLDSMKLFLDYLIIDSLCFIWKIQNGNADLVTVNLDTADIANFIDKISTPDSKIDTSFTNMGKRLYDLLIGHFKIDFEKVESLTIIPSGILNYLPFEALVVSEESEKLEYFIEMEPKMNYCYSVNTIKLLDNYALGVNLNRLTFAGFGKNEFKDVATYHKQLKLSNLKSARSEIKRIAELFPNSYIFTEDSCTKQNLQRVLKNGLDFLHIASHTISQGGVPKIVFSPNSKDNGLLDYLELYSMMGMVKNVNLSACNTALGTVENIEGVISLARAFHKLGASNIQAALWFVDDQSTSLLMNEFYKRYINEKMPPSKALQEAKLIMLGKRGATFPIDISVGYSHPYYWAPFICIGRG